MYASLPTLTKIQEKIAHCVTGNFHPIKAHTPQDLSNRQHWRKIHYEIFVAGERLLKDLWIFDASQEIKQNKMIPFSASHNVHNVFWSPWGLLLSFGVSYTLFNNVCERMIVFRYFSCISFAYMRRVWHEHLMRFMSKGNPSAIRIKENSL